MHRGPCKIATHRVYSPPISFVLLFPEGFYNVNESVNTIPKHTTAMSEQDGELASSRPEDFPDPKILHEIVEHINASGALGRSKVYAKLLTYLLEKALLGAKPKEIEIAMDVLGRDAGFDVSKDSLVRVYVYQLRKKLDKYYREYPDFHAYRLSIPKGQYVITLRTLGGKQSFKTEKPSLSTKDRYTSSNWVLGVMAVLLMANLALALTQQQSGVLPARVKVAANLAPWNELLNDDLPILIVMGDYYIFGELNDSGNVRRMVRDFNINSPEDLNNLFLSNTQSRSQYLDLNLNYMPEGSAMALANIVPVLQKEGKRVSVSMMSRLSTADLKSSHIIYIGYISGLDKLRNLVFAASNLQIGRTYDELVNRKTGIIYSSDAGLPQQNEPFRDYGLFATFPGTSANQVVIIAGTRDAGLMHTAQAATTGASLNLISETLLAIGNESPASFEALFEVFGFDRLDFDANLVHSDTLDPGLIWSGEASDFSAQ